MSDEIQIPDLQEIDRLVQAAERIVLPHQAVEHFPCAIGFAAYTGIRLGELLALEWADLTGDELLVSKQLRRDGARVPPKNGHARTVLVPSLAMDALEPAMRHRDILGHEYGPVAGRIFNYSRREHTRIWGTVREDADVFIRWHDLRHYAATWLLELGVSDWDVALQLGHRDGGKLVRERYGHPSPRKARDRMRKAAAGLPLPMPS